MNTKILILLLLSIFTACTSPVEESDAYGNFEAETVLVSAEHPGRLLAALYDDGDILTQNQILAMVDTSQIALQLIQVDAQKASIASRKASVNSQIEVLKEQKRNLQINEARIQNMMKSGASTQQQLDEIQGKIKVIERQMESTNTQYVAISMEIEVLDAKKELIQDQLRRCTIRSPIKGTILEKYVQTGEYVNPGKNLYKVADLSSLDLRVFVSGAQLPEIKLGQEVEVLIDKNDLDYRSFNGRISWISSEAEFTPKIIQTKQERVKLVYAVRVKVENDGSLKIGMPGEIKWSE